MSDNYSDNSVSKCDLSTDLQTKYSKLASEYSKIRAQNSVLKKAVIDEQARNTELSDALRNHEQTIRKSSQEMESLNFRNIQLSRRVVVLQEELDFLQNNQKRKKGKTKNPPELHNGVKSDGVLDEELKKMIMENATLLSTLQDKEIEYEKEIAVSREELRRLTDELEICHRKLKTAENDYRDIVEELKKQNEELKFNSEIKDAQMVELERKLKETKQLFNSYMADVNPKYEQLSRIIKRHLPFIDDSNVALNKLNVEALQEDKNQSEDFSHDTKMCITDVMVTFHNIVQCTGIECKQSKYSELFSCLESSAWKGKTQLLKDLKSSIHALKLIMDDTDKNQDSIDFAINKFADCFLNCLARFLTSYTNGVKNTHVPNEFCFTNNLSLEKQLQTYIQCKKEFDQRCTNFSNINNTQLLSLSSCKLDDYIKKIYSKITKQEAGNESDDSVYKLQEAERAVVAEFKKQAVNYMSSLKKDTIERVPYKKACQNQRDLRECITLQNHLKEELLRVKMDLELSEKEKIHWLNEYKLLEIKYSEKKMQQLRSEWNPKQEALEVYNELGKLTLPYAIEEETLARENAIKNCLNERLHSVIAEKQDAYSKARTFMFESILLQKRLENRMEEKDLSEQRLLQNKKTILQLHEELATVTENYELQLRTMSEHLANVNDKLASQSDTIEELTYQLNNKVSKR